MKNINLEYVLTKLFFFFTPFFSFEPYNKYYFLEYLLILMIKGQGENK